MKSILVTGCKGLVGGAVAEALLGLGYRIKGIDLRLPRGDPGHGDVQDAEFVKELAKDCQGIIHMAGMSRVIWGEKDPELCWAANVGGTRNVLNAALTSKSRPWVLFSSSREVYGEPESQPVPDDAPLRPVNVYGRSKAEAERLMLEARREGLNTAIVRLSNVYGRTTDHPDRVVPAFARGAAEGSRLTVCGSGHTFDFTHIDDTVRGVLAVTKAVMAGETVPPMHLLTGRATTLGELARIANKAGGGRAEIIEAPERNYDVANFVGNPAQAWEILRWRANMGIADGVSRLVADFIKQIGHNPS
jgi:nucleoside-diphosphate-sugar epimerase